MVIETLQVLLCHGLSHGHRFVFLQSFAESTTDDGRTIERAEQQEVWRTLAIGVPTSGDAPLRRRTPLCLDLAWVQASCFPPAKLEEIRVEVYLHYLHAASRHNT